jgi:hypothetical protein
MRECLSDQSSLPGNHLIERDVIGRKRRNAGHGLRSEQVLLEQALRRDQQRVAADARQAVVRGAPVAGRIERQYLPQAHPRTGRPVEKREQLVPEITDAVRSRERCRVK